MSFQASRPRMPVRITANPETINQDIGTETPSLGGGRYRCENGLSSGAAESRILPDGLRSIFMPGTRCHAEMGKSATSIAKKAEIALGVHHSQVTAC